MTIRRFSVAVIVLGALLASVGTIQADESFTRRSLNGTNAFSGAGTFGGLPAAVVGLNTFDGRGICQISARLNSPLLGGVMALASASARERRCKWRREVSKRAERLTHSCRNLVRILDADTP